MCQIFNYGLNFVLSLVFCGIVIVSRSPQIAKMNGKVLRKTGRFSPGSDFFKQDSEVLEFRCPDFLYESVAVCWSLSCLG